LSVGLRNFLLDCEMNPKMDLLESEFGTKGFGVMIKLYQYILGKSYFVKWDMDVGLTFCRKWCPDVGINLVSEVVDCALRRGIFDKPLFEQYGILTSKRIQESYLFGAKRFKRVELLYEYLHPSICTFLEIVNISGRIVSKKMENVCILPPIEKKRIELNRTEEEKAPPLQEIPPSSFSYGEAKCLYEQYAPTYFKAEYAEENVDTDYRNGQAFESAKSDERDPLAEESFIELLKRAEKAEYLKTRKNIGLRQIIEWRGSIMAGKYDTLFKKEGGDSGNKRAEPHIPEHLKKRI